MLNFHNLTCVIDSRYSFVGISKKSNALILYLPKGFQNQLKMHDSFEGKRDLFFLLYRVLREFKVICIDKEYLYSSSSWISRDRDGVIQGDEGSTTTQNLDDPIIFHAKLDSLDILLSVYDELKISALSARLGNTNKIDLSKLDRYLHKGVFLPNGAIYIDSMVLPRYQVQFESTDIVSLYCYLVREVKTQLEEEITPEVSAMAERFQHHYLGSEDGLFLEDSYDRVVDILKEALDTIDRRTPFKDADYDDFYEAIEKFLYADWEKAGDGEIWGVNNFHSIWESICLTYLTKTVEAKNLLFLDRTFISNEILTKLDLVPKSINIVKDFKINGKNLIPDVLTCSIFPKIQSKILPRFLSPNRRWSDDYSYYTMFNYNSNLFQKEIRIAYMGQARKSHTFDALPDIQKISDKYILTSSLPKKFYSYWEIDLDNRQSILEQCNAMQYVNHIFYVSICLNIYDFSEFCQKILIKLFKLSIEDSRIYRVDNVFSYSLLRGICFADLKSQFNTFMAYIFSDMIQFELIDVKYLTLDYIQDPTNISDIRERSIRKQFVYEYLLQEQAKKLTQDASPSISSSFWVPDSSSEEEVLSDGPKYLDGYLKLVTVDVESVMRSYVS